MIIKKIPNQIIKGALEKLDLSKVDSIAFHHTASTSMSVKDVEKYHIYTNGWVAIGYNYFIDTDGTIYEGRGFNKGAGVQNHNSHIISIVLKGNFETQTPTQMQYNSAKELVKYLKKEIPAIKKVGLHKDWNATLCPGKNFDISKVLSENTNELTSVNDIVWELSYRGIITDKDLWMSKLETDNNAYWLARKTVNYLRKED